MPIINGYTVTSSNGGSRQQPSVRVKKGGSVLAVVYTEHSQPLSYIRRYINCDERASLAMQMTRAGVAPEDIEEILRFPDPK